MLNATFVYVTHWQSEAFAMANRVIIMHEGEISQIGSPKDIYRSPANQFVAEFVGRNSLVFITPIPALYVLISASIYLSKS